MWTSTSIVFMKFCLICDEYVGSKVLIWLLHCKLQSCLPEGNRGIFEQAGVMVKEGADLLKLRCRKLD